MEIEVVPRLKLIPVLLLRELCENEVQFPRYIYHVVINRRHILPCLRERFLEFKTLSLRSIYSPSSS